MSPHAYTEDQLVERPAIELFAALGWETVSATDETFGRAERSAARPKAKPCGVLGPVPHPCRLKRADSMIISYSSATDEVTPDGHDPQNHHRH